MAKPTSSATYTKKNNATMANWPRRTDAVAATPSWLCFAARVFFGAGVVSKTYPQNTVSAANGTATGQSESVHAMARLVRSGADKAPIAKNRCRALSAAPGDSGRLHTTNVLPETSPTPHTIPSTTKTATSGASSRICEITTMATIDIAMHPAHT